MSVIIVSRLPIMAWHLAIMPDGGFTLSVAAWWGSWGVGAASPETAEITTAAQPAIIAVTILFTLMIDSFRVHD